MSALHLLIHGRVQGVGFRDWLSRLARAHGLKGWVRNLADGRVEAVIAGPQGGVQACLVSCRQGPPWAEVTRIEAIPCPEPDMTDFE
ncbi:MAG: acylphosphatase, partial [Rhodospirillales bacterium]|nr:acylphosphatase [Rhodospirillales bacterium]